MVEKLMKTQPHDNSQLNRFATENERLRIENAQLRVRLKPFANIKPSETAYYYWVVIGTPDRCSFTQDDLLSARKIVASKPVDTSPESN